MTEPSDSPRRDLPVIGRRKALALSAAALGVAAWGLTSAPARAAARTRPAAAPEAAWTLR